MEKKLERSFVRSYLPWLVAAGAVILYFITLNRSLSLAGVLGLARMLGWDWHPVAHAPLFYALTLPIRWLPAGWQLTAGSLFSLLCALLTLALLARSVSLLSHDRTREQRLRDLGEHALLDIPTGWVPPLMAVLVCGLQLSFWEQATMASGEMLDLLIFAYVARCLLEYRVDGRESWLSRLALVYGLGTANNWAMIGYFPGFLIAMIWIMGLGFFRYRFLVRTTLWGLGGLLLYLLLPLLRAWSDPIYGDFLETLRLNLGFQRQALSMLRPYILLLLSLSSVLPLLVVSIRWPTSMGDISAAGYTAATLMMYVLHAAFFAICLYSAFDPPISPRQLVSGMGVSLLSLYYVSALCAGYFCGFFLLLFTRPPGRAWDRPSALRQVINGAVTVAVLLVALGVPAALFYRNIQQIQARNSSELDRYGKRLADSLPAGGAVVLSDDPVRLYTVRAMLGPRANQFILMDTSALLHGMYHHDLRKRYGARLPDLPSGEPGSRMVPTPSLLDFLARLIEKTPTYYLHPSFGYYFERFYQVPHLGLYEMKVLATNAVEIPPLSPNQIQQQEEYWRQFDQEEMATLKAKVERFKTKQKSDLTPLWVASYYARARNHWGVQLNINRRLDQAIPAFERALDLNPYNACAFVNLEWSRHWKQTGKLLERFSDEAMTKLQPFAGNWDLLLSINGPMDEPTFRMELAQLYARNGLSRQAAQQVLRVLDINPGDMPAAVILGNVYVQAGLPEKGLELISGIRANPALAPKESRFQVDFIAIEAWAAYARNDLPKAEALLRGAQEKYPQLDGGFFTLAQMYLNRADLARAEGKPAEYLRYMTNALQVFEKQTRLQPANMPAMVNYGGVCAQLEDSQRALAILSRAVELDPSSLPARVNRAITYLRAGKDDLAKQDYDYILKLNPASFRAYFGLADIAYRKGDWFTAANNYELYLRHSPANTSEYFFVQRRLVELKNKPKR